VEEVVIAPLAAWESFYVIVGSSAAALTGLQFVVMALVAQSEMRSSTSEIDAFGTPTIVHFSAALLLSAILSAPWPSLDGPGLSLLVSGLLGFGYVGLVIRRARRQMAYKPVFEDWLWHAVLPSVAYVVLLVAAVSILRNASDALFAIGGVALLLLFIGIHNAWDTVTYLTTERLHRPADSTRQE